MQQLDRLPGTGDRKDRISSSKENQDNSSENAQAAAQNVTFKIHVFSPDLQLTDRRRKKTVFPPKPEVVWQQSPLTPVEKTNLLNIPNDLNTGAHRNTHMPELKQTNVLESQTLPIYGTSSRIRIRYGTAPRKPN